MSVNQLFYYKNYGIRNINELTTPRLFDLKKFQFPVKSILHYATYDSVENGPPSDHSLFNAIEKPIYFKPIIELSSYHGSPRIQPVNAMDLIRDYRNSNRRMKLLTAEVSSVVDPTALIVLNYCILNKKYKYIRNIFTEVHRWKNIFTTVIDTFVANTQNPQMMHYVQLNVPNVIPSVSQLDRANKSLDQATLQLFKNEDSYTLLELWKWLDPKTSKESVFDKIPLNKLHLFNIIYIKRDKWCVLNLGTLSSYRSLELTSLAPDQTPVILSKLKLDPQQIQKRLLRLMMSLETGSLEKIESATDEVIVQQQVEEGTAVDTVSQDGSVDDDEEKPVVVKEKVLSNQELDEIDKRKAEALIIEDDDEDDIVANKIKLQDLELDQDLNKLTEINERRLKDTQADDGKTIYDVLNEAEPDLDVLITDICDKLADNNLLTAGEYKRFIKLADSYKRIPAKDGKSTLEQYIKIDPSDLKIDDTVNIPDSDAIVDKKMLKSSLEVFDKNYINKDIIGKDNAAMVLSLQKAGIIVSDYKVIKHESILGAEEEHVIRVVPIEGLPSTLRFKIPVVQEDGSFTSNSIKYSLRKQIGEIPIRKISHSRVALTSYYGKTFINRGKKKAKDYGIWLQNSIMAKGLDKEDTVITDLFTANVFDSQLNAPRAYTALSMTFTSFKCRGYNLLLNHKEILNIVDTAIIDKFEKDNSIIFGHKDGVYLLMDKNNAVYSIKDNKLEPMSTIEDFLGLDASNAPVEFADIVVSAKDIPVGVVLGYYLGFNKLLKLLKLTPVSVPAGKRVSLQSNEYSLVFSDETLIFSKDDRLATLIIGGFTEYHKTIRMFNLHSFDKKGVYVNLLESNKLGARYVREMDLMQQMFIDPITKEILIEMKEPTTFNGLLVRACELLLDDKHPDEFDTKFMRIKGYERIPGAIYKQLVGTVRQHNSQLGKNTKHLDMNPYAVWKHVTEDPTKVQINEMNPIQALKETEAVTYSGTGGRSFRAMVKHTRSYHRSSMGTISESTVDSSDVGINIYLSANPQFTSVRGLSREFDFKEQGAAALISTSAMMAPGSDKDDQSGLYWQQCQ